MLGAPRILQSDNGREFTASVIGELKSMWSDLVMVHGKPRHPQSQGSVERLNCDIKDMLVAWLAEHNSTDWAVGLKFVQFMKNTSYHSGINQEPYRALFGCAPRVGLRSASLPEEVLETLQTEEELLAVAETPPASVQELHEEEPQLPDPSSDQNQASTSNGNVLTDPVTDIQHDPVGESVLDQVEYSQPVASLPLLHEEASGSTETVNQSIDSDAVTVAESTPTNHRKRAREGLLKQAQRMTKRSRLQFVPGNVGDTVTIPIPLVDRGRGDPRNILGVIVDRNENDMYKIVVKGGILNVRFARNQFDVCSQTLLTEQDVSQEQEISLRNAVQFESNCGGQGYAKCNCSGSGRCLTNRCKCFKAKVQCNSRCHACVSCPNKH